MQDSLNNLASEVNTGEDFIKRVDNEITPKYKFDILTSQASANLISKVPGIAGNIDAANKAKTLQLAGSVLADNVTKLQNTSLTFNEMKQKAEDRKSTRLNSSHTEISSAVFCLKKKKRRGWIGITSHKECHKLIEDR